MGSDGIHRNVDTFAPIVKVLFHLGPSVEAEECGDKNIVHLVDKNHLHSQKGDGWNKRRRLDSKPMIRDSHDFNYSIPQQAHQREEDK